MNKLCLHSLGKMLEKADEEDLSFVKEADINLKIKAEVMYYLSAAAFAPYPFCELCTPLYSPSAACYGGLNASIN